MYKPTGNWRDAMKIVSADIDDEFGEPLIFTPCAHRPNYQPEPSGPSVEVVGVFRLRGTIAKPGGVAVETRTPMVEFDRDRLPFPPEHGTRVQRVTTGALYEVESVTPDGVQRVVCHLNQLGLPDPT